MDTPVKHRVLLLGESSVRLVSILSALHHHHHPSARSRKEKRVHLTVYPPRDKPCNLAFDSLQRRVPKITALDYDYAPVHELEEMKRMLRKADIVIYCYQANVIDTFDALQRWRAIVVRETAGCKLGHASVLLRCGVDPLVTEADEIRFACSIGAVLPDQQLQCHSPPTAEDLDAIGLKCCRVSILLRSSREGVTLDQRRACPPHCRVREPHRHEKKTSDFLGTEDTVVLECASPKKATMHHGLEPEWMRSVVVPPITPAPPLPKPPQPALVANNNHPANHTLREDSRLLVRRGAPPPPPTQSWSEWLVQVKDSLLG